MKFYCQKSKSYHVVTAEGHCSANLDENRSYLRFEVFVYFVKLEVFFIKVVCLALPADPTESNKLKRIDRRDHNLFCFFKAELPQIMSRNKMVVFTHTVSIGLRAYSGINSMNRYQNFLLHCFRS